MRYPPRLGQGWGGSTPGRGTGASRLSGKGLGPGNGGLGAGGLGAGAGGRSGLGVGVGLGGFGMFLLRSYWFLRDREFITRQLLINEIKALSP